ncbi:MAG: efflux RND transporter periplasmic adaptor subunit, partial [Deltaproteobacteria bacterium]|nr:efflux RND transporter periplasmic adaptor subunit [Deltaproteobacteria bacterium]
PPSLESLSPSAAMIEMADDSALYAEVDIDETDAAKVRNSEKVRLIFDQLDASDFYGEVTEVYPYVQREADQNRTVRIKVKIPEELKGRVLIGMSVDAEVIIGESADTIYVPSSAVVEQAGRKFVYVAENGRLKKVEVETGLSNWEKTEIKSGLKDGDQVLVPKALDKMKEGVEVIVTGGRG